MATIDISNLYAVFLDPWEYGTPNGLQDGAMVQMVVDGTIIFLADVLVDGTLVASTQRIQAITDPDRQRAVWATFGEGYAGIVLEFPTLTISPPVP